MITATATTLYLEDAVADRLGVSRADIRYLRRELLKKKKDWTILDRKIVLTQAALERVVAYLRKASNTLPPALDFTDCRRLAASEKKEPADELELLTVRKLLPNPRILMATDPAGAVVQVRVRDNKNFRPRMTLRARRLTPLIFTMEGRCPRFPGRY